MAEKRKGPTQFPLGNENMQAMLNIQKELLDAYQEAGHAWLERVKLEADFWSDLANKFVETKNVPEALAAYQQSIAQRMQMAAEDGRRLFEKCQKISQKLSSSLTSAWNNRST